MPLMRYTIRNEYSLADPELYRAADKDDPEALLEGVAMAGLVGVLRQLGDLAEFAAEIFHDLHEELMATAARGHGLMVRVQQIESEFPLIEKAFLSQSSHSSFFYNTGLDWHPSVHMDQNLVTQGDLPRFVMDSYEECRGPPRLFLLDKFDVAGAGACLKRYTDPSFFKVESSLSGMPNAEGQREKKSRKSKLSTFKDHLVQKFFTPMKKGSRWKNGETPEVLSTSHVKLQQLFLEESVQNHIMDPARRVKLKRRLNGFPFDSTTGKSYMDSFLKNSSSDHDVVREISMTSSPSKPPAGVICELGVEVLDISAIISDKGMTMKKRSLCSSTDLEDEHKPYIHNLTEEGNCGVSEVPKISLTITDVPSIKREEVNKREKVAEEERNVGGYQSDDAASEVDNYVDALTTMDSEMETDSEYRPKDNVHSVNVDDRWMGSDATEELYDLQTHSTDSQSIGNSSLMDSGNNSSRKGKSSFSYSGSFDLAENPPSDGDVSARTFPSAELCEAEFVNSSSKQHSVNGDAPSSQTARHIINDGACKERADVSVSITEFEEPSSPSCLTDSSIMFLPVDPGTCMEVSSIEPDFKENSSNYDKYNVGFIREEENSAHQNENVPCASNFSVPPFLTRDNVLPDKSPQNCIVGKLNGHDTYESHPFLIVPNVLNPAFDNERNEDLLHDMMKRESFRSEFATTSVAGPVESQSALALHAEQHLHISKPENETCNPRVKPEGDATEGISSSCPIKYSVPTTNLFEMQLPEIYQSFDPGVKLQTRDEQLADGEILEGFSPEINLVEGGDTDLKFASELEDPPPALVPLDGVTESVRLQAEVPGTTVACSNFVDNVDDITSLKSRSTNLQEKSSLVFHEICQNGMEYNEEFGPEHLHESSMEETVDERADVSLVLESVSSKIASCDSHSESYHRVCDSFTAATSGTNRPVDQSIVFMFSSCQPDAESNVIQKIDIIEYNENVQSLPSHAIVEISTPLGQQTGKSDVESCHDQVSKVKCAEQIDVFKDKKDYVSSPEHSLAEPSPLYQQVQSENNELDGISCQDLVLKSRNSKQIDAMVEEDDVVSSLTDPIVEPKIPVEERFEPQKDRYDAESQCHQVLPSKFAKWIDIVENDEVLVSSPVNHIAELRDPLDQKNELQRNQLDLETWHVNDSESKQNQELNDCENADDDVSEPTDIAKLQPPLEQNIESQLNQFDVKFWHDRGTDLEHPQQTEVDDSKDAVSSDCHEYLESTPIDNKLELQNHLKLKPKQQEQSSTHLEQERETVATSDEKSATHLPNISSLSEFLPEQNVSKPAEGSSISNFPSFDLLPDVSQINLDETPPLPPLPPMQWRLGKVKHTFPAPETSYLLQHTPHSVPSILISMSGDLSDSSHLTTEAGVDNPLNPLFRFSSQGRVENSTGYTAHSNPPSQQVKDLVDNRNNGDDISTASGVKSMTPVLVLPMDHIVKSENVLPDSWGVKSQRSDNAFSLVTNGDTSFSICSFPENQVDHLHQQPLESLSDEKIQGTSIVFEDKNENSASTSISPPVMQENQPKPVFPTVEEHVSWPSNSSLAPAPSDDAMLNGNQQMKLPRPRNPLIDAVVAHDKSKLRKVTERPQTEIVQQTEERGSLLEQIRAKSFNLKPAVVKRPSIQGPKTNLRVAAILEKANAIRQAFAGSDEDTDEDGWSDS